MTKTVLTRKAAMVQGALTAFLIPRLAKDAQIDVVPLLADIDGKNFPKKRAALAASVAHLATGKLAKDAKLDDLPTFLMAFDAMEPEEKEDEEKEKEERAAKDKKAEDEEKEEKEKKEKEEKEAKDKKAKDEEKEKEEKAAKDKKGKDAEPEAMTKEDAKKAMDEAITGERQRQRDVREAERFVRAWIGDLAVAYDSAEDVYKAALESRGKSTKGIHPSAYRSILEMLPKPGTENRNSSRVAMDASNADSFATMFPDAMKVKVSA